MTIRFRCNRCSLSLTAEDDRAGASFKCPRCGQEDVVPAPSPGEQPPAASTPSAVPEEPEPPEETLPLRFRPQGTPDDAIDMTPMIDMVFQLLIFFMVTTAYSLQKSLEIPPVDREQNASQARTVEEIETDDDYVIIRIAKDNTVWVNEQEAPSEQEVLVKLREAREGPPGTTGHGPTSLLVLADIEARHETVVMCLDAGGAVGMENVRLSCVNEDDL